MTTAQKKRIIIGASYVLIILLGCFSGYSLSEDIGLFTVVKPHFEYDSPTSILNVIFAVCSQQMIQYALIFIFGFTAFSHIVNCAVLYLRGCSIGYSALLLSGGKFNLSAVCFLFTYILITVVMIIFIVYLSRIYYSFKNKPLFRDRLRHTAEAFLLFFIITGASALIKSLPIIILTRTV